jgi:AcrR family transcriptional regulator
VSQTAPYRHFADKEALLAAMATRGYRAAALRDLQRPGHGAGDSGAAQLRARRPAYVDYAASTSDCSS